MENDEKNVIWLSKGEKRYALLFAGDRYHLITINEQYSKKYVLKLLKNYPCSEEELHHKNIRFVTIMKKDIFGVRFDGKSAGSEFLLRVINQKTRKYTLTEEIDSEKRELFSADVRRLPVPWDNAADGWRKEQQESNTLAQMKVVKLWLSLAAILLGAFSFFVDKLNILWTGLFLLVPLICILLVIMFPTYFTLADWDDKRKPKYGIGLSMLTILPLMFLSLRTFSTNYIEFGKVLICSAICGVLICLSIWIYVKEFRDRVGYFLLISLIVVTMCSAGIVGYSNRLLDTTESQVYTYAVEELRKSSGKGTTYYCCVTLFDGKEIDICISQETYEGLTVGDFVRVAHRAGGLGLEYVFVLEE